MSQLTDADQTYFAFAPATQPQQQRRKICLAPVPDLLCKRYRIERLLGVGGMGAVFRARDLLREQLGDPSPWVALKTLSNECAEYPDAPTLLHSEFVRTLRLRHPGVIRALHFDIDPGSEHPFIVMELLNGLTLDQLLLRQSGEIPWREVRAIGCDLVAAVAYCHLQGTVHGDIKPSNILVGNQGLRLFDFGLGRSLGDALPRLDPERFQAWTPRYAAPEILDGEPVSCASDVYSLGRVLLELSGAGTDQTRRRHPLPGELWQLLNRAIASQPDQRCTASQLLAAWKTVPERAPLKLRLPGLRRRR